MPVTSPSWGSGVQGKSHLEAMRAVRKLRRVRIWSRNEANSRAFVEWAGQRFGSTSSSKTARDAVNDADLICTCTSSGEPILSGGWLSPGTHINVVGSSIPTKRESTPTP
jgi:ornithine cyclodeaminase